MGTNLSSEKAKPGCLASQQIREKIKSGRIISNFDESRIQPSSFEPIITNEIFVIDTEKEGMFRPRVSESVYKSLLQLPGRQRQKFDISNGYEIKKGFTYLFPLEERILLSEGEYVKSSPKSSFGRLFLNTRLLADYNPCFDEINFQYKTDSELGLWLLVQPLTFNLIVYPGLTLNQLRFFRSNDAKLNSSEVLDEIKKNPILFDKAKDGSLVPSNPYITDGLQIHLDLSGQYTEGIVGLRARKNPTPIDLRKKAEYEAEHFFEPVKGTNAITIARGEHFLVSSKEELKIPEHLNVELKGNSHIGITGPLHFAGFIDNGFEGDLVFEIRSDEISSMVLEDNTPISKLDLYRTEIPDKIYGTSIGSNYNKQTGPRPSKYFKPFDFTFAARNYEKLSKMVLVHDAKILSGYRTAREGFEFLSIEKSKELFKEIENGFFQSRYDCEFDRLILQLIPYVVFLGPNNTIFAYVRANNIKDYGDARLFGKHSIGVGGHICKTDGPNFIQKNIEREVFDEEIEIDGNFSGPKFIGTLLQYDKPVDQVHFGLIFVIKTDGSVKPKESALVTGKMIPIEEILADPDKDQKYETWSKALLSHLHRLQNENSSLILNNSMIIS